MQLSLKRAFVASYIEVEFYPLEALSFSFRLDRAFACGPNNLEVGPRCYDSVALARYHELKDASCHDPHSFELAVLIELFSPPYVGRDR